MNRRLLVVSCLLLLASLVFASGGAESANLPMELTFLRFGGADDVKQMDELNGIFQTEHPGAKIELLMLPFAQFKQKLDTMVAGGEAPDVVFGWPTPFAQLWANGKVIPLDDYVKKEKGFDLQDFSAAKQFTYNGKLFAIPFNNTAHLFVYNKTLFDKAKLITPTELYAQGKWDWDHYIEVAKALTVDEDGDGVPDQYGSVDLTAHIRIMAAIWSFGGRVFNDDFSKILIDSPEVRKALQLVYDAVNTYKISPPLDMDAQGIGITFNTGKIAIGGQSAATLMYTQINHNQPWEWRAIPLPAGPAGHAHWADGNALAISSACMNPDLAWDYVNLLTSKRAWDVTLDLGIPFRMPPRLSVINGEKFRKAWSFTDVDMLVEAMSGSKGINPTVPSSPGSYRIVYEVLVTEVQNYVKGVQGLEATIATIKKQAEDILADYR